MSEEDITFEERETLELQKNDMSKYWKKQNLKRVNIGMSRELVKPLRAIRSFTGFTSDDQTLRYLLTLENDLRKHGMIEKHKICERCYGSINVKLDDYTGITHRHINAKSNCSGNITTGYRVKTDLIGTTTPEDEPYETTEQTKEETDEETDPARRALAARIKQFQEDLFK